MICGREFKRLSLKHLQAHGISDWEEYHRMVLTKNGDVLGLAREYRTARVLRLFKAVDALDSILMTKSKEPDVPVRDLVAVANYFSGNLNKTIDSLTGESDFSEESATYSVGSVNVFIPHDPRERMFLIQKVREELGSARAGLIGSENSK